MAVIKQKIVPHLWFDREAKEALLEVYDEASTGEEQEIQLVERLRIGVGLTRNDGYQFSNFFHALRLTYRGATKFQYKHAYGLRWAKLLKVRK